MTDVRHPMNIQKSRTMRLELSHSQPLDNYAVEGVKVLNLEQGVLVGAASVPSQPSELLFIGRSPCQCLYALIVLTMTPTALNGALMDNSPGALLFVAPFTLAFYAKGSNSSSRLSRRPRPKQVLSNHGTSSLVQRVQPLGCPQTAFQVATTAQQPQETIPTTLHYTGELSEPDVHDESLNLLEWPQISAHVLNYASTPLGRAALCSSSSGLHIPETRAASERLLAETREVYLMEYTLCKPLNFSGVHDVLPIVGLAMKGQTLQGMQLINVAETLASARKIRRHIEGAASPSATEHPQNLSILKDMVSSFRTWPEAEKDIKKSIDDFGDVVDSADPELRGIRNSLRDAMTEVRGKLNDIMARHSDAIQDRVITSRYDRFVIPVKISRKSAFRRGTVHDVSASGFTAYIEPASVRPLNDRLRQLAAKEKARVNAILRRLSAEVVVPIAEDVRNLGRVLAHLDAATARARCSRSLDAVDVVFDDEKPLRLLGARHPLLSWQAMAELESGRNAQGNGKAPKTSEGERKESGTANYKRREPGWKTAVVPSSYILDDQIRCVCVTGPNTGGKTLSLKTLGTCVLMAKAGLFVPAQDPSSVTTIAKEHGLKSFSRSEGEELEQVESARLPFFDSVLADIGDDQSLVQSLSTFSGHVRRIKRILAASTPKTLVLLDEIGSGTDPAEGAALGMAILRHLALGKKAALTFATTHHGELKTLKYSDDDGARFFENASVEFDDLRMAPTFKLIWGIPGRSNALAIANRLGLSQEVVDEARYLLTGTSKDGQESPNRVDIEKMISSLEREKRSAEIAREGAEMRLHEVEQLRSELSERLERLRDSEKVLRENQKVAMDNEVKAAKNQIARLIKDMQQGGGSSQAANKASQKLGKLHLPGSEGRNTSITSQETRRHFDIDDIRMGDRIVVPRLSPNVVEIVEVASRKEVVVAFGGMRAKVKVKEIASVGQRREAESDEPHAVNNQADSNKAGVVVRTAANTVDIRGERVDGAESRVDKAIDKGLAMGAIWVIHGHGTGRLRQGIQSFLNGHPMVERIEEAEQSDGGSGVTIAYLC